jgi:hypothetical protein
MPAAAENDDEFTPVLDLADLLRDFGRPWFVSGGWAIDLFLGQVTRPHSDIEVGLYRDDQHALRAHLAKWTIDQAVDGPFVPWPPGEPLAQQVHQLRATRPDARPPEFEIFLNEHTPTHWLTRRHPDLARPLNQVWFTSPVGLPTLLPEIQLLYKAKYLRDKDRQDFAHATPRMTAPQRAWLKDALTLVHPGHEWLAHL